MTSDPRSTVLHRISGGRSGLRQGIHFKTLVGYDTRYILWLITLLQPTTGRAPSQHLLPFADQLSSGWSSLLAATSSTVQCSPDIILSTNGCSSRQSITACPPAFPTSGNNSSQPQIQYQPQSLL